MPGVRLLVEMFLAGWALNLVWEFSHSPLYETCWRLSWRRKVPLLVAMALKDEMLILLFYLLVVGVFRSVDVTGTAPALLLFGGLALGFAFLDETISLRLRRWEYTTAMPTVFGVGVAPFLELAFTGVATLMVVFRLLPRW